ncbi:hypothetical protein ATANTOWER_012184 [Ataeniobius toweri]|uniref:Uncharacterized protein n=1 Tax=Ataeniobius toweri TaxID=208326 RepID=A0ABU7AJF9_9TELE|nr:hypothetical protein [Ataeniobius toweri]
MVRTEKAGVCGAASLEMRLMLRQNSRAEFISTRRPTADSGCGGFRRVPTCGSLQRAWRISGEISIITGTPWG